MVEKGGKTRESFLLNRKRGATGEKKKKFGSKDLKTRDSSIKPHLWLYTHMKKMMKGVLCVMKFPPHPSSRHLMIRIELTYVCTYLNSALFIISNDVPLFEVFHHNYGFLKCSPLI